MLKHFFLALSVVLLGFLGTAKAEICNCAHGTPYADIPCPPVGDYCSSCNTNYILENFACVHNNPGAGVGGVGAATPPTPGAGVGGVAAAADAPDEQHGPEPSPEPSPQLDLCFCDNGVPTSTCPNHGAEVCASCDAGFRLENGKCVPSCDGCLAACDQADAGTTVLRVYSELSHCGGLPKPVVHEGVDDCSYSCLAAKCTPGDLEAAYPALATKQAC